MRLASPLLLLSVTLALAGGTLAAGAGARTAVDDNGPVPKWKHKGRWKDARKLLRRGELADFHHDLPLFLVDFWFSPEDRTPFVEREWSETRFPRWSGFQGEAWTHGGKKYRLVDIGALQSREDGPLFEPIAREILGRRTRTRVRLAGPKLEAEQYLHKLRNELTRRILQKYARERSDRFQWSDLQSMVDGLILDSRAPKRTFVVLEDPPADISTLTPEQFGAKALATFSLENLREEPRKYGARYPGWLYPAEAPAGRDELAGEIVFDHVPGGPVIPMKLPPRRHVPEPTLHLERFSDFHRPVFRRDATELEWKLKRAAKGHDLWSASRLVKLRDDVPEAVFGALLGKVLEIGTGASAKGRPGRPFAFDALTFRALSRIAGGRPAPLAKIRISDRPTYETSLISPFRPHPVEKSAYTEEGIYYFDETVESLAAVRQKLGAYYREVSEGP